MDFVISSLAALASILGDYGAAFLALGLTTYMATAYFALIGQKTIYMVNAISPEIEQLKSEFDGRPKELNRALLELYARKGVNTFGFLPGLVPSSYWLHLFRLFRSPWLTYLSPYIRNWCPGSIL